MCRSTTSFRTHPGDNPTVESGRLTFLYWEDGSVKTKVLDCVNNADLLTTYQASSYGKSSIGHALGMNCGKNPRGEDLPFIFFLAEEQPGTSVRKIPNAVIGSEVVACLASLGHNGFCLESWRGVDDPEALLLEKFSEYRTPKAPKYKP